jgi:hypothetical protein
MAYKIVIIANSRYGAGTAPDFRRYQIIKAK